MGKIYANGINLYYEKEGSGHPLILISGYTTDLSVWTVVRKELSKHFALIMFDNRGAGRSDSPDHTYTIDLMADDTKTLIKSLGIQKPHVLGHSMGGAIAQTLAFMYPNLVYKMVLANTFIQFHTAPAFAMNYFLKMRSQGLSNNLVVEGCLPWLFSDSFLKDNALLSEFLQAAASHPYPQSIKGEKHQLEALLRFNSEKWFMKIATPTLIIEGEKDILCPKDSHRLANNMPNAKIATFSNQAHMPHFEIPDQFAKTVIDFLK